VCFDETADGNIENHRVGFTADTSAAQLHKAICATCDVAPSSVLRLSDEHGKVYAIDPATLPNGKKFTLSLGDAPVAPAFAPWGESALPEACDELEPQPLEEDPRQPFKVLLLGSSGTGKSCFVARHKAKNAKRYKLPKTYEPTVGAVVNAASFEAKGSKTAINCRFWEVSGADEKCGIRDIYYAGADAAIIFFHLGEKKTYWDVLRWKNELRAFPDMPIMVCGVGSDLGDKQDPALMSTPAVCMSNKNGANSAAPILYVLRRLTGLATMKLKKEPKQEEPSIDWDALTTHICSTFG